MRKSRVVLFVLLALMLCVNLTTAAAESEDRILSQIAAQMEVLNRDMVAAKESLSDSEAQILYDLAIRALNVCQNIHIKAMGEDGVVLRESLKDLQPRDTFCGDREDGAFSQTESVWLEDMNVYANSDVIYREGYLSAKYSIYDDAGNYLGTQRVEHGKRNDEILMLIVDYDNIVGATGRFALRIKNGMPEVIFTKTFGMHMDIVLDVSEWQRGEEIEEWDKALLLPAV